MRGSAADGPATQRVDVKKKRIIAQRYTVPALDKALDIVELLAATQDKLTMREIGRTVGRSVSQIFRTLKVLEQRGYIERDGETDRFGVTNRLFELGMTRPPMLNLTGAAYPVMIETAAALDQSLHLAVPSNEQMVVIARVENPGGAAFLVKIGNRRSLADAVSGRVLLAFQPQPIQDKWLALVRKAKGRGFDEAALRRSLAQIRERGYEHANSAYVVGITDIGVPLFDGGDSAVACLSMPFVSRLDHRRTIGEAIEAMRVAARRVTAALAAATGRRRS
ncbi:MAG: helix-turn-helix domain-containing protein [Alphaproteobacteria bacterium]|nr:helix-turn-helix domain-containing protein [Alphaproteobacteria bacterium]